MRILMKRIPIILLLLSLSWAAAAQQSTTLTGTVTDEASGDPLPGVAIFFPDLRQGALSDMQGRYTIGSLPQIRTQIQVSLLGHQTIVQDIDLKTVRTLDFSLKESNATLSEVVVTGLTGTETKRNSPAPVTIVTPEILRGQASSNLIDALAKQPGVSQITTGGGISKPVIRGMGYNRVLVVTDGVRQEGQQWGDEHGVEVDAESVNSVEILKGPASLMYGSDALAGVVVLHGAAVPPQGKIGVRAGAEYQSNNGLLGYTVNTSGNQNGLVWNWRWTQKVAHDYRNAADGLVPNSRYRERGVSGLIGLSKRWGYSHLKLSWFHLTPGMVEGEREEDGTLEAFDNGKSYRPGLPFQQVNHYKAVWDNSLVLGEGSLKATVGYQQNRRQEFEESADEPGLDFLLHTVNYNFYYKSPESNGWKNVAGVGGMWQASDNLGEEVLIPAYHLFDAGTYITTCKDLDYWHISAGIRADARWLRSHALEDRFAAFDRTFFGITGSVGAIRNLGENANIRLNLSRGFRAPNISELGSNGEHEGTFRYEVGNPDLKPEYSWQLDAGFDYSSRILSAEVSLFTNLIQNYIYLGRSAGETVEDAPVYRFLSGLASLSGGEATVDVHPVERLHFENAFSYVIAVRPGEPEESRYLPFTPAPRWLSTLRYDLVRDGKVLNNTYISAQMDWNFAQNRIYAAGGTETATPGYILLNLSAGTDFRLKGKTVASLYLTADNLLDTVYQSHLSRLKYAAVNPVSGVQGVFNPGRNLGIKLILKW